MTRGRKLFLALLLLAVLTLLLPAGWFLWRTHHALPPYDGQVNVAGLQRPVRILRDERAVPHLSAASLEDLLFAQGYVHAQERLWQMETLRRTVRGQLSEILGPATVKVDKDYRRLNLGGVADRAVAQLDAPIRLQLEAYARGVNAYIESHPGSPLFSGLPIEFALLNYRPEPWRPGDSLAIGLYMFRVLYTSWPTELARSRVADEVGPERAADLYVGQTDRDHPLAEPVAAPRRLRRQRIFIARRLSQQAGVCAHSLPELLAGQPAPTSPAASNNWVLSGAHTASGAPLLANDTHLFHSAPSIWFLNHLTSPEVDVLGFSVPGIPLVIIGHNERIAWGVTNMMVDVQDLFIERFNPEDPSLYMTPTGWQRVQRRVEHIRVRGGETLDYEVLETRHGPIIHDDGNFKLALQWTARDPSLLTLPLLALNQARNWEEFTQALNHWSWAPQNFVYADREGNIGYYGAGRIPRRRTGYGQLPVPGDSSQFDWVEYIPFQALPHAFNPESGRLATANNRIVPDDYPYYLTDRWVAPSRIHRIFQLLQEEKKFTPEDFLRVQGDILSLPDLFLAEQVLAAARPANGGAEATDSHPPRRAEALEALRGWDGRMRAEQSAPALTNALRTALLEELLRPYLGDDWELYSWFMSPVFLENVLKERPERWLPEGYANYDELLLAALDRGVEHVLEETRAPTVSQVRWGEQLRVRFVHPLGERLPVLRRWFSLGGQPQSGGRYTVKQTHRTGGVSMRFVMNFADPDASLMSLTLGQSGHLASPHYHDQLPAWLQVRSFPAPFSDTAVERAARHTFHLLPR
ncbi:MAG: penicillin acylase family protein [Candidatus Acidoferrales bacterium]